MGDGLKRAFAAAKRTRQPRRVWAVSCADGKVHPGIIFDDTTEGAAEILRAIIRLDEGAKAPCGEHKVMELKVIS